jgi:Ni,Fe-hydrogenase I large subunit
MAKKIVIDPITRIEGHLKIETEIYNNGKSNKYLKYFFL